VSKDTYSANNLSEHQLTGWPTDNIAIRKNGKAKTSISTERKVERQIFYYQCKGLFPWLSGTSGSAFHFETTW